MVTPFFHIWTSHLQSHQKGWCSCKGPPPSAPCTLNTSLGNTWTQSSVNKFLSLKPCQYNWNHHRQDLLTSRSKISHCLLQAQIFKSKHFNFHLRPSCNYKLHTLPHPALKGYTIFLTACRRCKESLSILRLIPKFLNPYCLFVPLIDIKNKKIKFWTHPAPLTLE